MEGAHAGSGSGSPGRSVYQWALRLLPMLMFEYWSIHRRLTDVEPFSDIAAIEDRS